MGIAAHDERSEDMNLNLNFNQLFVGKNAHATEYKIF